MIGTSMGREAVADTLTTRSLARVARKRILAPILAGAAVGLILGVFADFRPVESFASLMEPWINASSTFEDWLRKSVAGQALSEWLSAPVLGGALFWTLSRLPPGRRLMERLIPAPPWFVTSSLEEARRLTMINLEREPLDLIGRQELIDQLWADLSMRDSSFRWRMLIGPTGIGKTRVAIELLERFQRGGWDVGIVDIVNPERLAGWRARKPTALLIDDARRNWGSQLGELILTLMKGADAANPVRLIVGDQMAPAIDMAIGVHRSALAQAQIRPPLRVPRLTDEQISTLGEKAGGHVDLPQLTAHAAGRPRAALVLLRSPNLTTYAGALNDWAELLVPGLLDEATPLPLSLAAPLLLSALAGPIETDNVRAVTDIDVMALSRFYDDAQRASLETFLPALEPEDLAHAITLRLLPRIDARQREKLVEGAIASKPAAIEERLGTMWRYLPVWTVATETEEDTPIEWLLWLQNYFDGQLPDRISAVRVEAEKLLELSASPDLETSVPAIQSLYDLARTRPFDAELRFAQARGAARAIKIAADAGAFEQMESWGRRLLAIGRGRALVEDPRIGEELIRTILPLIERYGIARRPDDSERWAQQLLTVASTLHPDQVAGALPIIVTGYAQAMNAHGLARQFAELEAWAEEIDHVLGTQDPVEPELRRLEAFACTRAMCCYGRVERISDMERWGDRLLEVAGIESLTDDWEIQYCLADGAADVMGHYRRQELDRIETWGKLLLDTVRSERFADDVVFRLKEAEGSSIAMRMYESLGRLNDMARWGTVLLEVTGNDLFSANVEMRYRRLHAAGTAILGYGKALRHTELEEWATIVSATLDDERFGKEEIILEIAASIIVNLSNAYGRVDEIDKLQAWGERLFAMQDGDMLWGNEDMATSAARAASNALGDYAQAGRYSSTPARRWFRLLAAVAREFPACAGIQVVAAEFGLTATDQLLNHYPHGEPRKQRRTAPARPALSGPNLSVH